MATKLTITVSDPVFRDVERLRTVYGYENRSAWIEYLISRGLEAVRRELELNGGESHGNGVAVATA